MLTFSHVAVNTQKMRKACVQGLQCGRGLALSQHIPQREMFPIKWQSPGRPPRSIEVKDLTPQKKAKEWVQNIPVYIGGGGAVEDRKKVPCHPFVEQELGPLVNFPGL